MLIFTIGPDSILVDFPNSTSNERETFRCWDWEDEKVENSLYA